MATTNASPRRDPSPTCSISIATVLIVIVYFGVQITLKIIRGNPPAAAFAAYSPTYEFGCKWGAFVYTPLIALILAVLGYGLFRAFVAWADKVANCLFALPFAAVLSMQVLAWCGVDVRTWFRSTPSVAAQSVANSAVMPIPSALSPASNATPTRVRPLTAPGPQPSTTTQPTAPANPTSTPPSTESHEAPALPVTPPRPTSPADKRWVADPAKKSPTDVAASLADEGHPARVALDTLAAELQGRIDDVLLLGVKLDDLIKRPIPSTKPALAERFKPAEELVTKCQSLTARLRDADGEASARLTDAGQDMHTASVLSSRFAQGIDAFQRAMAAQSIERVAEASAEFFHLLHDNAGKWTVNGQGDFTVKDSALKTKIFFARSTFEFQRDRLTESLRELAAGQPLPDPKAKPK